MAGNTRRLNFSADDLPKNLTLMLTFETPDAGELYKDLYPCAGVSPASIIASTWILIFCQIEVIKLQAGGPTGSYVVFKANTAFLAPMVGIQFWHLSNIRLHPTSTLDHFWKLDCWLFLAALCRAYQSTIFLNTFRLTGLERDLQTGEKVTISTPTSGNVITRSGAGAGKPGLLICENVGTTAADVGLVSNLFRGTLTSIILKNY